MVRARGPRLASVMRLRPSRSRRTARAGRAVLALGVVCGVGAGLFAPGPTVALHAQTIEELTATPEAAADGFLRSIRAIRWETVALFLHPETQTRFRTTVEMIVDADTTGAMLDFLVDAPRAELTARSSEGVFDGAIGAVIDDMPGLMHAMFDRDDVVVGAVPEGADDAHVVYRTTARLSGAVSEVKVLQMRRSSAGWRVVWSDELEVLDAALRGISRRNQPPPPPG